MLIRAKPRVFLITMRALKNVSDMKIIRYIFLWVVLGMLLNIRLYKFCLIRSYLKWVDDEIDGPGDPGKKERFLARLRQLWEREPDAHHDRNQPLLIYIKEMLHADHKMQSVFEDFFDTFAFDVARRNRQISEKELSSHIVKLGVSALRLTNMVFDENAKLLKFDQKQAEDLGTLYILTDMLLDLDEDLSAGIFNIPENVTRIVAPVDVLEIRSRSDVVSWVKSKIAVLDILYTRAERIVFEQRASVLKKFLEANLKRRKEKFDQLRTVWR